MKKKLFLLFYILFFLLPIHYLHAQPVDPGADPAPIDGDASILAAVCAGCLAKKRRDTKSVKNND